MERKDRYQSLVRKVLVLSPSLYIDIRKLTPEKISMLIREKPWWSRQKPKFSSITDCNFCPIIFIERFPSFKNNIWTESNNRHGFIHSWIQIYHTFLRTHTSCQMSAENLKRMKQVWGTIAKARLRVFSILTIEWRKGSLNISRVIGIDIRQFTSCAQKFRKEGRIFFAHVVRLHRSSPDIHVWWDEVELL